MRIRHIVCAALIAVFAIVPNVISTSLYAVPTLGLAEKVHPNPFTEGTTFQLSMPNESEINISVFDLLGKHVRTIYEGLHPAGQYPVPWDGKDKFDVPVAPGMYLCVLAANGVTIKSVKVVKVSA